MRLRRTRVALAALAVGVLSLFGVACGEGAPEEAPSIQDQQPAGGDNPGGEAPGEDIPQTSPDEDDEEESDY